MKGNESGKYEISPESSPADIKESEELYKSFVEGYEGIAYKATMGYVPFFFKGAVEEITGYKEEEFTSGKIRWDQVIHPEDFRNKREKFEDIANIPNLEQERKYRIVRKDGVIRWVCDNIRNICDKYGKPYLVQGTIRDITESELAEQALVESEERFRKLFDFSNDAIFIHDLKGNILDANYKAEKLFGHDKSELLEMSVMDLHPSWARETSKAAFTKIAENGYVNFEIDFLKKNGEVFPAEVSAGIFESGGINLIQGIVRDISERKQAEEKIQNALAQVKELKNRLQAENIYLKEEIKDQFNVNQIIGKSESIRLVLEKVDQVSPTNASVLIYGETGTGKELIARAIHAQSPRRNQPMIKVNCASIPRDLFESEFFGHVKGAFTGAVKDRIGRFQLADGGTLFLDEVGEIPLELQGKLLRVLQEGTFERVGEEITRNVNVRIIASTNRNLENEIAAGRFRRDLFFRLSVFPIELAPLRQRRDDIALLAGHFLEQASRRIGKPPISLKSMHITQLQNYSWPGNIRELQNAIEFAVITSADNEIHFNLPYSVINENRIPVIDDTVEAIPHNGRILTPAELRKIEADNITAALEKSDWKIYGPGGAAELLGIKPTTLSSRIKALGINRHS